jgi:signal transduction histidine kinase
MGFPILLQGRVLGVLEFFTGESRPADQETLQLVHAVGQQLGQMIARSEAQVALRNSYAELERFAYTASHDLQEPLRTITTLTEILLAQRKSEGTVDTPDFLGQIATAARSMQILITDLLAYAQATMSDVVREEVSLDEILRNVLHVLSAQIESTGAVITHGELPTVTVAVTDLQQILQNLLSNSLKYYRPGEPPRIRITAISHGSRLVCSVADNGQGIPASYHEHIFQPFKRLHDRKVPGTGLGLAICKRLVERHGGTLSVTSQPNEGATFTFTLPQ